MNNEHEALNDNIEIDEIDSEEIISDGIDDMWKDAQEAAESIETSKHSEKVQDESKHQTKSYFDDSLTSKLKNELESKDAQLKRMMADFDNFRRRQAIEREEILKMASKDLIQDLLPTLDNFDRAISSFKDAKDIDSVISGIELVQKQLVEIMKRNGLEIIQALDNAFDPNFHEAVQKIVDETKPDETVISELQKGYTLNGKVLRPSMVVVSAIS